MAEITHKDVVEYYKYRQKCIEAWEQYEEVKNKGKLSDHIVLDIRDFCEKEIKSIAGMAGTFSNLNTLDIVTLYLSYSYSRF